MFLIIQLPEGQHVFVDHIVYITGPSDDMPPEIGYGCDIHLSNGEIITTIETADGVFGQIADVINDFNKSQADDEDRTTFKT